MNKEGRGKPALSVAFTPKVPGALVKEGTLMTSLLRAPRPTLLRGQACPGKGLVSEENQQEEELA